jgi:hypothetical protein
MKNRLLEEQLGRIKRLIKENNELSEVVLTEQPVVPTLLRRFLGRGVVSKLETSMGDDVIKNLESLFARSSANFIKDGTGEVFLLSRAGTKIPMKTVSAAFDNVATGKMTADDLVKLLPSKLKDGTDFKVIIQNELKNAKPKPTSPKPGSAPKPRGGRGFGSNFKNTVTPAEMMKEIELDPVFSKLLNDPEKRRMITEWVNLNCKNVTKEQFILNAEKYLSRFPATVDKQVTNWFQRTIGFLKKGREAKDAAMGSVYWGMGILIMGVVVGGITGMDALRVVACRLSNTLCEFVGGSTGGGNKSEKETITW